MGLKLTGEGLRMEECYVWKFAADVNKASILCTIWSKKKCDDQKDDLEVHGMGVLDGDDDDDDDEEEEDEKVDLEVVHGKCVHVGQSRKTQFAIRAALWAVDDLHHDDEYGEDDDDDEGASAELGHKRSL